MIAFGYTPSKEHFYAAIRSLGRMGCTEHMTRVATLTKRAGIVCTQSLLNSMLFAHAKRFDTKGVHAVAAELENLGLPLSDESFKRLVLAHFCVQDDDRAFKILDMYRASGGPIDEILTFTLNNVGALASVPDSGAARAIPKAERQAVSARVVRKIMTYLALSPAPAPEAVAVLLHNLVFNTKRSLLAEALAHRRIVELAQPQLLERAAVALTRSAMMGLLASFTHSGHIKLTLHEFASGVAVTRELVSDRVKNLRYAVDPAWDEWLARNGGALPTAAFPSGAKHRAAAAAAQAVAAHAASDDASGHSTSAGSDSDSSPPSVFVQTTQQRAGVSSATPVEAAEAESQSVAAPASRGVHVAADARAAVPLDADLASLTADQMAGNMKRRLIQRVGLVTAAAVKAATGSQEAAAAAKLIAQEAIDAEPATPVVHNAADTDAGRSVASHYIGPLLGALDPGSPFTTVWRLDASLRPEERTDRSLRFACGLVLHLEALGHEVTDTTYRVLFSTLALHRKTVAALQIGLRLEARGATLSDAYPLDRAVDMLRTRCHPEDYGPLIYRMCGALLPPPLLAAYRSFASRVRRHSLPFIPAPPGPPTPSPATAGAEAAVTPISEPVPPTPAPSSSAEFERAQTLAMAALAPWGGAGYPILRLESLAPSEEDRSLRLQMRGGGFWDPSSEVHQCRDWVRGDTPYVLSAGPGKTSGGGAAAGGTSRDGGGAAQRTPGASAAAAAGHDGELAQRYERLWFIGGPAAGAPRYNTVPPDAPQPPLSDVLPGTTSMNPGVLDRLHKAERAALAAAAAATVDAVAAAAARGSGGDGDATDADGGLPPGGVTHVPQPEALLVLERWAHKHKRFSEAHRQETGHGLKMARYFTERPPYLHWLPMPAEQAAAARALAAAEEAAIAAVETGLEGEEGDEGQALQAEPPSSDDGDSGVPSTSSPGASVRRRAGGLPVAVGGSDASDLDDGMAASDGVEEGLDEEDEAAVLRADRAGLYRRMRDAGAESELR